MITNDITAKEKEILQEVVRFRFKTRSHIQHLLHHKDEKTIQLWLNNLVSKQYLVKDEEKLGKKHQPVYYMGRLGIRFLKTLGAYDSNFLRNLYREKQHSPAFVSHRLSLADICLTLKKLSFGPITFTCYTLSDYSSPLSPFSFLKELKPALLVEREEQKNKRYMLFEIIPATFPFYRMKKKIRDYLRFLQGGTWEAEIKTTTPQVFFIVPTYERKYQLKHYTKTLLERSWVDDISINFTTEEKVRQEGVNAKIWEEVG